MPDIQQTMKIDASRMEDDQKTLRYDVIQSDDKQHISEELPTDLASTRFDTIVSDTQHVTDDKLEVTDKDVKRLVDLAQEYEILDEFAEGGQGLLATARDKILNRYVVIKSLKERFRSRPKVVNSFIAEAKVTAQLDHPSIIPLYSINNDTEKGLHMAMKLIKGHTMREVIDHHILEYDMKSVDPANFEQLRLAQGLENFIKVCDAVDYAHKKGVVHRDLKPANIMTGEFHEVYVMDWGIARTYSEDKNSRTKDERLSNISGTPGYIAPEIFEGEPLDPAIDQFSLGMILFEIVTLIPGIDAKTLEAFVNKTRNGEYRLVIHRYKKIAIHPDLAAIIKKAIATNPKYRYASVADLANDIRRFLHNEETEARPDDLPRKTVRWLLNHKMLTGITILVILLVFAGITITSLIYQQKASAIARQREMVLVSFHGQLVDQAHDIDRYFLQMAGITRQFAQDVSFLLQNPIDPKNSKQNFYDYRLFKKIDKNSPTGTVNSPLYKQNVSMMAGNYKLAPGLSKSEAKMELATISPLLPTLLPLMSASYIGSGFDKSNPDKVRQWALENGFPVRWMYFGLKDGLLVNYPGTGMLTADYDPRKRPWYKDSVNAGSGVQWSKPYDDAFGQGLVISASTALRDDNGNFLGVAGIDITFDYIINKLMIDRESGSGIIGKYLVDKTGNVVLSTRTSLINKEQIQKGFPVKLKHFPYPEVIRKFNESGKNYLELERHGRSILLAWAPVQTLNWFYVEEVVLDRLMNKEL